MDNKHRQVANMASTDVAEGAPPSVAVRTRRQKLLNALAIAVIIDQMLLPMLHIGEISFKPSYLVLGYFAGRAMLAIVERWKVGAGRVRLRRFSYPIIGMALCGLAGQMYLSTRGQILDPYEAVKQQIVLFLSVGAFALGQRARRVNLRVLLFVLFAVVGLILLLSFAATAVPGIAQLWWTDADTFELQLSQNEIRPTPFGDGSMVPAGTMLVLLAVAIRRGEVSVGATWFLLAAAAVATTSFLLGSRNQLIASLLTTAAVVGSGTFRWRSIRKVPTVIAFASCLLAYAGLKSLARENSVIEYAINRIETLALFDTEDEEKSDTILRPLLNWERFTARFTQSPIIGSGYSTLAYEPFERLNFHNDLFHVFATSGIIGGMLYLSWLWWIRGKLGELVLLPFVLPGLTNTFILHISGILTFSLVTGVLIERKGRRLEDECLATQFRST